MGLRRIKELGGRTIVQSPETAEVDIMPRAAMAACAAEDVVDLNRIAVVLNRLAG